MKRNLSNHECVVAAGNREEFSNRNNTIYGRDVRKWDGGSEDGYIVTYTVYSYGTHYPMYVYDYQTGRWYGNNTKSTRTTGKHKSLLRPHIVEEWYDTDTLDRISRCGIVSVIERRLAA